eukprot:Pgem_evm1s2939
MMWVLGLLYQKYREFDKYNIFEQDVYLLSNNNNHIKYIGNPKTFVLPILTVSEYHNFL